jgi:FdhD protein
MFKNRTESASEGENPSITWRIERIYPDRCDQVDDPVVMEEPLEILVNGQRLAILMRLPGHEKELAVGFCISEGYVRGPKDILLIQHCGQGLPAPGEDEGEFGSRNRVEITVAEGGFLYGGEHDVVRLIRSGCGAADVSAMSDKLPFLPQGFSAKPALILGLGKSMRSLQSVYHQTGGTHAAALFDATGHPVHVAEDIGRHNAVDKVAGYCLLRRIPLQDKILVISGRASYEMAAKAIRLGIPLIAAASAPTSLAVHLAQDRGLTLIGYLRGSRMNVYTHSERLRRSELGKEKAEALGRDQ